jgi:predicted nucleotidyltransferase
MQRPFLNSVVIKSANRAEISQAVASYVTRLREQHPEIEQVIWFGSWVSGLPTPGSDVDLCLVVSSSDQPQQDRAPGYLPVGFPVGIDLFVYTRTEFERLPRTSPGWYRAIAAGKEL